MRGGRVGALSARVRKPLFDSITDVLASTMDNHPRCTEATFAKCISLYRLDNSASSREGYATLPEDADKVAFERWPMPKQSSQCDLRIGQILSGKHRQC